MEIDCKMNKKPSAKDLGWSQAGPCRDTATAPGYHGCTGLVQALHDTEMPEVPTSRPVVSTQGHATSLEHVQE